MRIAIYVKVAHNSTQSQEITYWESATVNNIEQARAHTTSVFENNWNVSLAFFTIVSDEFVGG